MSFTTGREMGKTESQATLIVNWTCKPQLIHNFMSDKHGYVQERKEQEDTAY